MRLEIKGRLSGTYMNNIELKRKESFGINISDMSDEIDLAYIKTISNIIDLVGSLSK